MQFFVEVSLLGLAMGGVYALIALGYVLVYKTTGVINFAHGNVMMVGAYFFFTFASLAGLHWGLAVLLALGASALLGAAIERILLRPLLGRPVFSVIMVTVGLASILHGGAQLAWSPEDFFLPSIFPEGPIFIGEMLIPANTGYGFLVAAAAVAIFYILFRFTRTGVAMRATASDQIAASSMGINVPALFSLGWIYAALSATVAGVVVGSMATLNPTLGLIGLEVLAVVILGGLDSIGGAIVAGLIIGWLQAVTGFYLGGAYKDVVPYVVVLVILVIRPYGLFGSREIERV